MSIRGIAATLTLLLAAPAAHRAAAGGTGVVRQSMTFESGGRVIDVAVYRPDDSADHPAIVYLHGGGFSFEDPLMARFHTELARRGLVVLAPHYLLNRTGWPHWNATATDAVTFARTLPGVDPDRIGMSGISMGGQVALSAAARDPRVKAVAEFFTAWPGTLPDEPIADLPPVLLLNGTADPIIPVDYAFQLDGILKARKMPYERRMYQGVGHGFGDGPAFDDAVARTAAFFGGRAGLPGPGLGLALGGPAGPPDGPIEFGTDDLASWDDRLALLTEMEWASLAGEKKRRRRRRPVVANPANSVAIRPAAGPSPAARP